MSDRSDYYARDNPRKKRFTKRRSTRRPSPGEYITGAVALSRPELFRRQYTPEFESGGEESFSNAFEMDQHEWDSQSLYSSATNKKLDFENTMYPSDTDSVSSSVSVVAERRARRYLLNKISKQKNQRHQSKSSLLLCQRKDCCATRARQSEITQQIHELANIISELKEEFKSGGFVKTEA